jgi:phytanoyl-CoA dioxygenase PhyH
MKRFAKGVVHALRLLLGLGIYAVSGKTPPFAYQAMVALFCLSGGRSNDVLSRIIGKLKPQYPLTQGAGVLGDLSTAASRRDIVGQLRARGFYVFQQQLPADMCDRLLQYALTQRCVTRRMDGGQPTQAVAATYPRGTPNAVRYDFDLADLLANHDVQRLLADPSLVALAQDYLGSRPVIDVLSMWWHTDFSQTPDSQAAQYFHFDMDRPKWLKIFIYLTDVHAGSGPHTFVAGSHRTGGIPQTLLERGYVRLADEEVAGAFAAADIVEFVAPRGTIIVEDTRGLHKGRHVHHGDRLMLQLQFSNLLFGGYYPKARLGSDLALELNRSLAQYPQLYSAYL